MERPCGARHSKVAKHRIAVSRIEDQSGARSVRREGVETASVGALLNRRHGCEQGIEGIEGKAIAVGMDRPVPWKKVCGARWGMVAKHRIPSRIEAQGGARSVRREGVETASSELLNTEGVCKA